MMTLHKTIYSSKDTTLPGCHIFSFQEKEKQHKLNLFFFFICNTATCL